MLLDGKTAVIFGGGGAIGGATARTFAREGARVCLAGRTRERLEAVAAMINGRGGSAQVAVVDASDEGAVDAYVAHVADDVGRIDICLNAVGIHHIQGAPLDALALADFERPIQRYLRTNFVTAKTVGTRMASQGGGVLLTISTPGSQMAGAGHLGYGVTCGAVETLSRLLAGELSPSGVRVICLRANAIPESLPISHVGDVFADAAERRGVPMDDWLAALTDSHCLLRKLPTLSDVAEYATFVASDRCTSMTGAIANLTAGALVD